MWQTPEQEWRTGVAGSAGACYPSGYGTKRIVSENGRAAQLDRFGIGAMETDARDGQAALQDGRRLFRQHGRRNQFRNGEEKGANRTVVGIIALVVKVLGVALVGRFANRDTAVGMVDTQGMRHFQRPRCDKHQGQKCGLNPSVYRLFYQNPPCNGLRRYSNSLEKQAGPGSVAARTRGYWYGEGSFRPCCGDPLFFHWDGPSISPCTGLIDVLGYQRRH